MYKFGNYICKLREEKQMTQSELAKQLDVSDKSVSKWENGQAFPRIETLENLATALNTTVEDIFSASKDGVNRICIANDYCPLMQVDINGQFYCIKGDETKWVEISSDTIVIKITGELLNEDEFAELEEEFTSLKEKVMFKLFKKATTQVMSLALQTDCTYRVSNIVPDSLITIEMDSINLGDKTLLYQDFIVTYPKIICADSVQVDLLRAKGRNSKEIVKKYKKLGLSADLGMDFITMILSYPLRGLYFKHLCKPKTLKKNILNAEKFKQKEEKRKKGKRVGCFGGILLIVGLILFFIILNIFVIPVVFVTLEKPYLVATDYSTITYKDDVYKRIDNLPDYAEETLIFGAAVWKDSRTDGLSKVEQTCQDNKVKLYESNDGKKYLWLVENYTDTILTGEEEDNDYEDFDEHYVYVCENPR